jgi:hypothetical protein
MRQPLVPLAHAHLCHCASQWGGPWGPPQQQHQRAPRPLPVQQQPRGPAPPAGPLAWRAPLLPPAWPQLLQLVALEPLLRLPSPPD